MTTNDYTPERHAHERAIRTLARFDFHTLGPEDRPDFDYAIQACSDSEPEDPALLAVEELDEDEAARIYNDEWDRIEAECTRPLGSCTEDVL